MPTSTPGGGQHETVILQDDIFIIGQNDPFKVVTVTRPAIPGPYVEKLVYSIVTGIGAVGAGRVVATNPTGIVDVTLLPPFQPPITPGSLTESGSSVLTITGGSNALLQNVQLTVTKASATTSGYLSSTDWNTFNSKQNALTPANLTSTAPITVTGGVGSLLAAASISMTQAGTGSSGWLSASDWNTFNSKQGTITPASLSSTSAALSVSGGSNSVLQNVTLSLTQADITVSAPLTITGGSQAVFSATSISMTQASGSQDGYLSATDWNTFNNKAPINSPGFTGTPTAPTPATGDNSIKLATTAFVNSLLSSEFMASLGPNGYYKLAGGLIIQWGDITIPTGNGDLVNFNFSFPNAVIGVISNDAGGAGGSSSNRITSCAVVSTSSFKAYGQTSGSPYASTNLFWVALGY